MAGEFVRFGRTALCPLLSPPILQALAATIFLGSAVTALAEPLAERLAPCLACHGEKGTSQTPEVPSQ
jgi:hypothetical protein